VATKNCVRALGYGFGIVPIAVAEQHLEESVVAIVGNDCPEYVFVPSVQNFETRALRSLCLLAARGSRILITGTIGQNPYDFPEDVTELDPCFSSTSGEVFPVCGVERIFGLQVPARFRNDGRMDVVRKSHNDVIRLGRGLGEILWCGIPVELSDNIDVVLELYALKLQKPQRTDEVLVLSKKYGPICVFALINETSDARTVCLPGIGTLEVARERAGAVVSDGLGNVSTFGGLTATRFLS